MGIAFINSEINKYDYIIAHYNSNADSLLQLRERYPKKIELKKADFYNVQDIQKFADEIANTNPPNYIIHFPAVRCKLKKFDKTLISEFEKNMQVSVNSIIIILQKLLPIMVKAHYGKVVFILSINTIADTHKYITDYVTAKFALLGLLKSLSAEYKDKGIRINGISPDTVETKFISELPQIVIDNRRNEDASKGLLTASDIVPTIAYLLDEGSDCLYGENIGVTR